MKYTHCWNCEAKITHFDENHFFWCDEDCKLEHERKQIERRKADNVGHNPPERRGEADLTNAIIQNALKNPISFDFSQATTDENGRVVKTHADYAKKGNRKCGKCGESGHNARTCGKR